MEQLSLFEELDNVAKPEDEMIEKALLRGSGFENGKKRIHKFVLSNPSTDKFAKFLRDEYGTGGFGSPNRGRNIIHSESHDGKGIRFRGTDRDGNETDGEMSWTKAAEVITRMVKRGGYP